MAHIPKQVAEFLEKKTIAVVGVSRDSKQPANAIYRKLKQGGYNIFAVNPNAEVVEGEKCYPDLDSIPARVEGAVIVTHPDLTAGVARKCIELGIDQIWIHRSFGQGSVSEDVILECRKSGINCIIGGCPMMYCEPVDFGHKCMKWILGLQNRVPA